MFNLANRRYTTCRPKTKSKRFTQPVGVAYDPARRRLFVADSVAGVIYVFNDAGTPIAPRVEGLDEGDSVAFRGVYEWNEEGGVDIDEFRFDLSTRTLKDQNLAVDRNIDRTGHRFGR